MADKMVALAGGFKGYWRIAECVGTDSAFTMSSTAVPVSQTSYAINNYGTVGNKYKYTNLSLLSGLKYHWYNIGIPQNVTGIPSSHMPIFTTEKPNIQFAFGKNRDYDAQATSPDHEDLDENVFINIVHNKSTGNYVCAPLVITVVNEYTGYGSAVFACAYTLRPLKQGESTSSYPVFAGNISHLKTGQWSKSWGYAVGDKLICFPSVWYTGYSISETTRYINGISDYDDLADPPSYPDNPDPDKDPDDPSKDPDPDDGEGGDDSTGDGDTDSDEIPDPPTPSMSTELVSLYSLYPNQLNQLATFLWSNDFSQSINKSIVNPFDVIISLKYSRFSLGEGSNEIILGNVETGVNASKLTDRFFRSTNNDMITLNEHFGSFLDYSPYTKIKIYLPYVGMKELDTDLVMGSTLYLSYTVDLMSGDIIYYIRVKKSITGKEGITDFDAILYQFCGNCMLEIPVTGANTSVVQSGINSLTRGIANLVAPTLGAASGYSYGTPENYAFSQAFANNSDWNKTSYSIDVLQKNLNLPIGVHTGTDYQKTDASSPIFNVACVGQPYIFIERPTRQVVNNYSKMFGVPLNQYGTVQNFRGFVKFSVVHIDQVIGSEDETTEINNALMNGIILPR